MLLEGSGYRDDEEKFEAVHAAMVDAMIRLERAFKPQVQKLSIESA